MKKIIFPLLVAVTTIAVVLSSPTAAEETQKGMGHKMPAFADCDLNGDGTITEEEFTKAHAERIAKHAKEGRHHKNLANAPSFDDIDTDDDGGVSPDEFSAHQAEQKAKRSQR